ncbi:MAG: efflux RND transporter permease subunit [Granulosicoccaceae bacterium]
MSKSTYGISGTIASLFVRSEITALLLIAALLSGVFAVLVTPREEEPQINVTFANVFIAFPGATAGEVESLISTPAEQVISEISGIKHVYSVSSAGLSVLTVQFKVGEDRTKVILDLYDKVFSNQDWLPQNLGISQPIIKPRSIDDIPIVTAALWSENPELGAGELLKVARTLEVELKRINGTRQVRTIGGRGEIVDVRVDPQKLAGHAITLQDLTLALHAANASSDTAKLIADNRQIPVRAGTFLVSPADVGQLVVGIDGTRPVYLSDVASVSARAESPKNYVTHVAGPLAGEEPAQIKERYSAVSVAIAKQPGTNAVDVSDRVIERLELLRGIVIPDDVQVTITRNYGETAGSKAGKLINKLMFATGSVVLLVILTMGWRPALVVGIAVVATLACTLMASLVYGFTINRVSLFALIFSIGILVDDAIVVVENIHRHLSLHADRTIWEIIPGAVDEVGGPTILATLTVIAALLPMAFVSGLMGPYMSPIPINASMGMLISLAIAFVITPWLAAKLIKSHGATAQINPTATRAYRFFNKLVGPFLKWRRLRYGLVLALLIAVGLSVSLAVVQTVVLKMLPFDNKSEFQVLVDLPEGSSVEMTSRAVSQVGDVLDGVPEVSNYQMYAGTSAPVGFNGLVRQYYLRQAAHFGDVQVNLVDAHDRKRKSHEIARDVREQLTASMTDADLNIKVVEVPPGPPVLSPLVAEIYGPNYQGQIEQAKRVRQVFESATDIVDVDDSVDLATEHFVIEVDRQRASSLGISQGVVSNAITAAIEGADVSYLHRSGAKYPIPIRVQLAQSEQGVIERILALKVRASSGALVPLSQLVRVSLQPREAAIHHKDLLPVVYVTGDIAGPLDSPLYGMAEIYSELENGSDSGGDHLGQYLVSSPNTPVEYSLKWDGEWQITYETFRDMGIAYAVGIILIYFLVVAQFHSYIVPLIIMAPIPLTVIGVFPGHAIMDTHFTATSMIGMIALAGIIVRNSILLVDFINQQIGEGVAIFDAVVNSSAVRAKPIILTGLAAMIGAFFIIDDPIFNGLAISLIFGILVSTLLTLIVIPVLYYAYLQRRQKKSGVVSA